MASSLLNALPNMPSAQCGISKTDQASECPVANLNRTVTSRESDCWLAALSSTVEEADGSTFQTGDKRGAVTREPDRWYSHPLAADSCTRGPHRTERGYSIDDFASLGPIDQVVANP